MTKEELRNWIDEEGGIDSMMRHGVPIEEIPEEVMLEWVYMKMAWESFDSQWVKFAKMIEY